MAIYHWLARILLRHPNDWSPNCASPAVIGLNFLQEIAQWIRFMSISVTIFSLTKLFVVIRLSAFGCLWTIAGCAGTVVGSVAIAPTSNQLTSWNANAMKSVLQSIFVHQINFELPAAGHAAAAFCDSSATYFNASSSSCSAEIKSDIVIAVVCLKIVRNFLISDVIKCPMSQIFLSMFYCARIKWQFKTINLRWFTFRHNNVRVVPYREMLLETSLLEEIEIIKIWFFDFRRYVLSAKSCDHVLSSSNMSQQNQCNLDQSRKRDLWKDNAYSR